MKEPQELAKSGSFKTPNDTADELGAKHGGQEEMPIFSFLSEVKDKNK